MKTRLLPIVLLSSLAALALSACGNKGPLVLPQKAVPVEAPAPKDAQDQPKASDLPAADQPKTPATTTPR